MSEVYKVQSCNHRAAHGYAEKGINVIEPFTYQNDFAEFLTVRDRGDTCLIDEEMFNYWLGVLPPTGANCKQNGESMRMTGMRGVWTNKDGQTQPFSFAFAEGAETITIFWAQNGNYFAKRTNIINPRG